ncbi:MAG: putative tRNA (cytidine(34)-2'-O)-methyltransferase [Phycisphaeraceae bacterium]|nr:MAG: putative tRNA (cytidine(34)-2'-O)-methyltransferase [Phycisphaeraceae bacterium]
MLCAPEIPNNTGNIGRTCVTTRCALHLIDPLGFDVDDKACRRAGLDYWPRLEVHRHADAPAYDAWRGERTPGARVWAFSARATRSVFDADLRPGDHLLFGRESAGLPDVVLEQHAGRVVSLPMVPGERSLNVANAVTVAVYEGVRQSIARGVPPAGGLPDPASWSPPAAGVESRALRSEKPEEDTN